MRRFFLGLLVVLFGVACGGDDNNTNSVVADSLAGSYDLIRLTPAGGSAIVPPDASGILSLTENRYSVTATYVVSGSSDVINVAQSGGYERSGGGLTLTADGGSGAQSGQVADAGRAITISVSVLVDDQAQTLSLSFTKSGS